MKKSCSPVCKGVQSRQVRMQGGKEEWSGGGRGGGGKPGKQSQRRAVGASAAQL